MAEIISAKTLPRSETDNYILVGPAGGGKSSLVCTLPGDTIVFLFDPSGSAAYRKWAGSTGHVDILSYISQKRDLTPYTISDMKGRPTPMQGQSLETGDKYLEFANDITRMAHSDELHTKWRNLIIDSGTTLQELIMAAVLTKVGRPGQVPQMTDYTTQMNMFNKICDTVFALPMNVLLLLHDEVVQDETTKRITNQLMLTGKLKAKIPTKVNHLMRCFAKPSATGTKYFIQTTPDMRSENIRTSFDGLSAQHDVTILDANKPQDFGLGKIIKEQKT